MSTLLWKHLNSNGVEQNIHTPASVKETSSISHQKKKCKRKKNIKKKNPAIHDTSFEQNRGQKRKLLDNKTECIKNGSTSDFVSEESNNMQFKRPRITHHTLPGESWEVDSGFSSESSPPTSGRSSPCLRIDHSRIVAMDCEMVGTGPGGRRSEVARCSIVDYYGNVVYDSYILPQDPVTDYRTRWSGIRSHHLRQAVPFEHAQNEILKILKGKIIVGHALYHDLNVLYISVQPHMIRDTCSCVLLRQLYDANQNCNISLKKLAQKLLNRTIQVDRQGHCSVEDALSALDLYKLVEDQWENNILCQDSNAELSQQFSNNSLKHYLQDQYWPENMMDCSL
uniref:Apoptosis-enhancing nuclease n=1 Tax=Danio rerio TaxID=7955 RepID=E7F5Q4_DANRE|nr:apoptosis-enhancing nuclease [Danio rerio]|eukprot:XP_021326351.1 apoptosis-enhancing nuclease [Danio rerio]